MCLDQNQNDRWKILLIGGSSGVGKTVVARQLAKYLSISLLLLDDVRLALQAATSQETNPDLHIFLNYEAEQWRHADMIVANWITVGNAILKPLQAIIRHHLIVPDVGPLVIEGDAILPIGGNKFFEARDVCTVFIVEQNEQRLLQNLRSRGRGFNDWGKEEQESFAHASWLYGQWIMQEADKFKLPVLNAEPQPTILERLLSVAGM